MCVRIDIRIGLLAFLLFLNGCASISNDTYIQSLDVSEKDAVHPATRALLELRQQVRAGKNVDHLADQYYSTRAAASLKRAQGWGRYLYTAPIEVFKNGDCKRLWLESRGQKLNLWCDGPYYLKVYSSGELEERMRLKVSMIYDKASESWKIDRSGVYITQYGGAANPVRYGERLKITADDIKF